ncbi:dihydroorotate dehydrogenase electron transfer subunit [Candidatus Woesearchaeota archaeon]|nr:MAG: dihydroorotate dehydrogenase electron transfer subunit [Candidatus Woesearchaeota archaeon]
MKPEIETEHACKGTIPKNVPRMVRILDVIEENPFVKTFLLDIKMDALPGQFVMVWLPGLDEKPMSVRGTSEASPAVKALLQKAKLKPNSEGAVAITVEARGPTTKELLQKKPNDMIGIRGPYGKPYSIVEDSIMVGGGVGMPPVAFLADILKKRRLLQGARTKERLLFLDQYEDMRISTDDGTLGHKGFVTELLEEEIMKKKPKMVYACGPELMMLAVLRICRKHRIPMEASLERYMRCGLGVCGSCVCGNRVVCVEGPVFNDKELEEMADFGKFALTKSARKVTLKEYYSG